MAEPTEQSDKTLRHKKAFLTAFARLGNITQACEAAEITRTTHYEWLNTDPDYAIQFEEAGHEAGERLEAEARRRAVEGVQRIKFDRSGKPLIDPDTKLPYREHEYSDTLLIFLLKGIKPEKYRERSDVQMQANVQAHHTHRFDLTKLNDDALRQLRGLVQQATKPA